MPVLLVARWSTAQAPTVREVPLRFDYGSVTVPPYLNKAEDVGQPVAEGMMRHAAREDDLVKGIDRAALSLV
jgi:hypothetical protein